MRIQSPSYSLTQPVTGQTSGDWLLALFQSLLSSTAAAPVRRAVGHCPLMAPGLCSARNQLGGQRGIPGGRPHTGMVVQLPQGTELGVLSTRRLPSQIPKLPQMLTGP